MRFSPYLVAVTCLIGMSLGAWAQEGATVQTNEGVVIKPAKELDVFVNGKYFTTYHYSDDYEKPFLWPVLGEDSVEMTRPWPMGEPEEERTDHPHHKSIYVAYGDMNGVDCWSQAEDSGRQQSGEPTYGANEDYGWIKADNTWVDKDGNPIVAESREYRFYPAPESARIFDVTVTFTAKYGDVKFGDTKEGGIAALRIRDQIRGDRNGQLTNAAGQKGEKECWGKPAAWCDYSGTFEDGKVRGITIFDNPNNLRYPTRWHARDYGLLGANCFGLSYFTKKEEKQLNGDYLLENGKSLTFSYRFYVHSGTPEEAKVAEQYETYIKDVQ